MKLGKIHIYAGDGKGKTTAATGLTVRAAGQGLQVHFVQFLKSGNSGELKVLRQIPGVTVLSGQEVKKFSFQMTEEEKIQSRAEMSQRLTEVCRGASTGDVNLLILDEVLGSISAGLLDEAVLLDFLDHKPAELEVVLTGRGPSEAVIARADYYTEMCLRKHPYETEGLMARQGIEF